MKVKYLVLTAIFSAITFTSCEDNKKKEQQDEDEQVETEREAALEDDEEQSELEGTNIIARTMEAGSLSTLTNALKIADLSEALRTEEGPFTLFAPTDEAFKEVDRVNIDSLITNRNQEQLSDFMEYHIVDGEITSEVLSQQIQSNNGEFTFNTMAGEKITAMMSGEKIVLRDASGNIATIIRADVDASNGVVHIIDAVIMKNKS